jgi:hypothetical protein
MRRAIVDRPAVFLVERTVTLLSGPRGPAVVDALMR